MATLTIRNLEDGVVARLKEQATHNGRSLEAEVREILKNNAGHPSVEELLALMDRIAAMTPKNVKQTDSTLLLREDRDLRYTAKELGMHPEPIDKASLPRRPGVYAIFAFDVPSNRFPAIQFDPTEMLYLGKCEELPRRGHFETGKTCQSTLRRTIGALLKDELNLRVFARGQGRSPAAFTNYRFDDGGEERLTGWMRTNLLIGFSIVIEDLEETEKRLIRYCEPALNLSGWPNPNAITIKALRAICADEARRNGPLPVSRRQ